MTSTAPLPSATSIVIAGAGFAGAATAAALARIGAGPGVIVDREVLPGTHASGRNAALAPQVEDDVVITDLAVAGAARLRGMTGPDGALMRTTGALYLGGPVEGPFFEDQRRVLGARGVVVELLARAAARRRFPFLRGLMLDVALFSPTDGVIDIHGLLLRYLAEARAGGFALATGCEVTDLRTVTGRVRGAVTTRGEIAADLVVDASGAWAGRLGRGPAPLPLRAYRRHLFVSGPAAGVSHDAPWVWDVNGAYYFRREAPGLLLSPCDAEEHPACEPATDPAAQVLLAEKLLRRAPGLADLEIRRGWACLRTFAPDERPVIGFDPVLGGLFHVSGLGGFGASTSPVVGEIAAALITGRPVRHVDPASVAPSRFT
jgi:glycine/D-amino acid oxidase-like deaminating enzyme